LLDVLSYDIASIENILWEIVDITASRRTPKDPQHYLTDMPQDSLEERGVFKRSELFI
jgi:hypothetical protein